AGTGYAGLQHLLTLRPDITFHDGSPLDAETLVWNFETLHDQPGSNSAGSIANNGIEEVEAIDDLTVVYRLSGPNAAMADSLRSSLGWPVSRQAYEEMGADEFAENPVGTGPFEFQQWTRDDRLVVTRNENYWRTDEDGNELPYLDEVEFRPITDEDSRYQSLAADSVQVMVTLRGSTAKQVLSLAEERNYRGNLYYGNQSGSSIFNTERPPVDDRRVRRALVAASDGEAVAIVLGDDGLVPPTNQFFNDESRWYSEEAAEAYPSADGPDLELADELITEYVNDPDRSDGKAPGEPVEVEYACPPDPSLIEIGQLYQQAWGSLGGGGMVEVSLRQVEQPELVGNAIDGDYMINCWRAGAGAGDPLTALQSFFSDPENNPLNFTNFSHPEIDEALVDLRTNSDFEVRYEAAETINRIANENSIMTWSIATPTLVGWRDDIHGLTTWRLPDGDLGDGTAGGHMHFSQVWLEQ
ncbi:MAG: ABC transporter substrate-binding protein, partial [Acidimicrobiales bacterium]